MRKKGKDYIITLTKYGFKVEAWDKYGKYIMDWWNQAEERQKSKDLMAKAILNCKEIDSKNNNLREIL